MAPSLINPANALTASRYLTLAPFAIYLWDGDIQMAGVMVLLCAFGDVFDGTLARKFNCASGFGELFDATTDAICYGFFMVLLMIRGMLPWAPIVGILVLGGVNSLFRVLYAKRAGRATNYRSFAMERLVGYLVYLVGFGLSGFSPFFYAWLCFGLTLLILIHDTKRMLVDPVPA